MRSLDYLNTRNTLILNNFIPIRPLLIYIRFVLCPIDGGFGYKHTYNHGNDADLWAVGARPGVAVNLTKKLSFVSHVGFLGWSQSKDNKLNTKVNQYGFNLDGNDITFSLYYNF